MTNARWSWSAISDNEETVVIVLWKDGIKFVNDIFQYHDDDELDAEWRKRSGSTDRTKHLKHSIEKCDGMFRAVIAAPKDPVANPREIKSCYAQKNVIWKMDYFDEKSGAFRAHASADQNL